MIPELNIDLPKDFKVEVHTTQNRGFTPEEIAERCADKIISVSDSTHPAIQEQVHAFRKRIVQLVGFYLREAVKSDRTTLYNEFKKQGHVDVAETLRKL